MDIIELDQIIKFFFSLLLVLSLMGLLAIILKKINNKTVGSKGLIKRLKIADSLHLSPKTKLFIVCCDDAEYLISSGPQGEVLLDKLPEKPRERLETTIESDKNTKTASVNKTNDLRATK